MKKKQTAVEWLFEQMLDSKEDNRYELLEEAKKMEQEQHENTYIAGMCAPLDMDITPISKAEQYFTSNYQSE